MEVVANERVALIVRFILRYILFREEEHETRTRGFTRRVSPVSSSRFSKSARRGAAAGRRGRPTGPPDGSERSPTPVACPDWTPARHPDARTPSSDMPPCRAPRPAATASADSRPASRPPFPPPFVSCNRELSFRNYYFSQPSGNLRCLR